jgi:ABC-type molybdate transport system substrate-binding protein
MADNINMATRYDTSGNADAVFTAYSLALKEAGKVIKVDEKLHSPIDQALGIVAASKNPDTARQFVGLCKTETFVRFDTWAAALPLSTAGREENAIHDGMGRRNS